NRAHHLLPRRSYHHHSSPVSFAPRGAPRSLLRVRVGMARSTRRRPLRRDDSSAPPILSDRRADTHSPCRARASPHLCSARRVGGREPARHRECAALPLVPATTPGTTDWTWAPWRDAPLRAPG